MLSATEAQTRTIAASYERVSTMGQARHGFSLAAQHASMEEFAAAQGMELPEHLRFSDTDSGALWDLPGLDAMLTAARAGAFSVLITPDLDRFSRSLVKGLVLEEQLRKYGARVVYQRVPVEDSPEGRLMKNQLFSFAEYEREKTLLRTMNGKRQKARAGQVVGGGPPPYGYRYTHNERGKTCGIEPEPLTAPIVRRIYDELATLSIGDVTKRLRADGIPAARGGDWVVRSVGRIANDPVYIGQWIYGKNDRRVRPDDPAGIIVPVEPLVTRATWDAVHAGFAHRHTARRGRMPIEEDPYLLRGVLRCGHCGGVLHSRPNSGVRYYACLGRMPSNAARNGRPVCDLPYVHAADIEREIWDRLGAALQDPEHLTRGLNAARAEHDAADRVRRDRLAALDAQVTKHQRTLDTLSDRLASVPDGPALDAVLRQMHETGDLIARLQRERVDLAHVRTEGLTQGEADAIAAFASVARAGIDKATPADRRRLYQTLRVQGRVFADADGILFGRKHRYRVEWEGAIELCDSDAGFSAPEYELW